MIHSISFHAGSLCITKLYCLSLCKITHAIHYFTLLLTTVRTIVVQNTLKRSVTTEGSNYICNPKEYRLCQWDFRINKRFFFLNCYCPNHCVIDADHRNICLFTNEGHFSSPLWVLIGVLAKFHE